MCGICGCSSGGAGAHTHHDHAAHAEQDLVHVEKDILAKNDRFAAANRQRLAQEGVLALNLVSSPGSGKTTLLVKTVEELRRSVAVSVIEGDQQTSIDAERIRAAGVRSIQVNTGRGCHLDAHAVGHAMDDLPLEPNSVLFIENVGNLVCPAGFDLGEAERVAILSVTEGDDKPLKYPDVFASANTLIISKIDLLPYVDFDVERCLGHARAINPDIRVLQLSAKTGHGMSLWTDAILASADCIRQRGLCHA